MEEIGNILREAREARGLTLTGVRDRLKIQEKYLSAMEEGRMDALPTPVHARGYLKSYAGFLELDPQPLLDSYQTQVRGQGSRRRSPPANGVPANGENPFFDPVNVQINPVRSSQNTESILRLLIIIALLIAILLVASRFFVADGRLGDDGSFVDQAVAALRGERPPTAAEIDTEGIVESAEVEPSEPLIIETGRNILEDGGVAPTAVPVFQCPTAGEVFNVRIEATQRVWMQLYIDDELQIQDNVRGGETLEYLAQNSFRINTGDAWAVFVTVNGVQLGRLGDPVQTIDVTCTTFSP